MPINDDDLRPFAIGCIVIGLVMIGGLIAIGFCIAKFFH
jgi:hypothetical protein